MSACETKVLCIHAAAGLGLDYVESICAVASATLANAGAAKDPAVSLTP